MSTADDVTNAAPETEEIPEGGVYTSETPAGTAPAGTQPTPRAVVTGSVIATGRRKEAVARVRLSPGTGAWTLNGRSLEVYFPNPVHRQIVREPFATLDAVDRFDVVARLHG